MLLRHQSEIDILMQQADLSRMRPKEKKLKSLLPLAFLQLPMSEEIALRRSEQNLQILLT
jgi:hypothetical protein